jgi:hypothetical protein
MIRQEEMTIRTLFHQHARKDYSGGTLSTSSVTDEISDISVVTSTPTGMVRSPPSIPEFLYQLIRMLKNEANWNIIQWGPACIIVHDPVRLENELLHLYFRHSNFSSFQRQLNYFGFRKVAVKGRMTPCRFVRDDITEDLNSLLLIKVSASSTNITS